MGRKFNQMMSFSPYRFTTVPNLSAAQTDLGYNLMFVPCIAGLCIENQHRALGFVNVFITNAAPTCFGTYVPSSGSFFVLVSTCKLRQLCTASGNVNLCALCAGLWCCTVLWETPHKITRLATCVRISFLILGSRFRLSYFNMYKYIQRDAMYYLGF
jgi:hypothetical protein